VHVLKKLCLLGRQKTFLILMVVVTNNAIFWDVMLFVRYKI